MKTKQNRWYGYLAAGIMIVVLSACIAATVKHGGGALVFSHQQHIKKVELACDTCHATAKQSDRGDDRLLAPKKACEDCHDVKTDCQMCHGANAHPQPLNRPVTGINFSHVKHLQRGLECLACHAKVDAATDTKTTHMPEMARCTTCHDGKKAPTDCNLCHVDLKRSGLQPKTHDALWGNSHGAFARNDETACYQCHESSQCAACHQGRVETAVHPRGFRYAHGDAVRTDPQQCTACHAQQYCRRCHG